MKTRVCANHNWKPATFQTQTGRKLCTDCVNKIRARFVNKPRQMPILITLR